MKNDVSFKPVIVDHLTYDWRSGKSIKTWDRSLTVPGLVMPLAEIIKRFTRGQAVPNLPVYNYEGDVSMFDHLDVFQRIDMQRKLAHRTALLESELESKKAKMVADRDKRRFDDSVAAAVAKLREEASDGK